MTLTLETEPLDPDPIDSTPPEGGPRLCACGCGEPLRDGAKRAFLRGHKARFDAENIGADPDPSDAPKRSYTRKNASARVQNEIRETIEAYLAIAATGFAVKDPICGGVALDIVPNVAAKAAPLLARNAKIAEYLTKSSNFKEVLDLALAILPLVQVIYAHHMSRTISTGQNGEPERAYNDYVA